MKRFTLGILAAMALLAIPASASAKTITACENTTTHTVRVAPPKCHSGEHNVRLTPFIPYIVVGKTGPQGAQGLPGIPGVAGSIGLVGSQGIQGALGPEGPAGAKGEKGDTGATGPQGEDYCAPKGEQGSPCVGPQGDTGPASTVPGPVGPAGPIGPTGAPGVSSPLVFTDAEVTGDPDSGECSSEWAKDNYVRTFTITPQPDGSFDVTVLIKGTFTTIIGAKQPGAVPCGPLIGSEVTGAFYGDYVIPVAAGSEFDPYATYDGSNVGLEAGVKAFVEAKFPGVKTLGSYAWQFHYTAPSGAETSWNNTDHGNTGNITG